MSHPTTPWNPAPDADASYVLFPKDRRVQVDDGTTIAYTVVGADGLRVPILLANGWSCSDAYWAHLVPAFVAAGHPCVVADTRGHGMSGLPRSPGRGAKHLTDDDVSMARVAADLVAVADDAGIDRFVVVGHSMGVQTGLEVERLAAERTVALVLIAGTYENPTKTFYGSSLGNLGFPFLATTFRWLPEIAAPVQATIGPPSIGHFGARLARAAGPKATAADLHPYLLHIKHLDIAVLMRFAAAMRDHSAADLLPRIDTPTLIVAAGADVFTPARCSEEMHRRIPDSETVTYREAGHTLPIEEPDAIAATVEEFLNRRVPAEDLTPARRPRRSTRAKTAKTAKAASTRA